jgi:hypothetical protein
LESDSEAGHLGGGYRLGVSSFDRGQIREVKLDDELIARSVE